MNPKRTLRQVWMACLLLMVVFTCLHPQPVLADHSKQTTTAAVATSFQLPLTGNWVVTNVVGKTIRDSSGKPWEKHLGIDITASWKTPVYAVANGTVVFNQTMTSWGTAVVVESTLPNNTKICSVYGHMRSEGVIGKGDVNKGAIVGYIGNWSENGHWSEHLHFGIRYGACIISKIHGYDGTKGDFDNWEKDPEKFIRDRMVSLPPQPLFGNSYATGSTSIYLSWTATSGDPERFHLINKTNNDARVLMGNRRDFTFTDLQCSKRYQFELWSQKAGVRSATSSNLTLDTRACLSKAAQITSMQFSPQTLNSGTVLNITFTVKNIGNQTIESQGPPPGFQYEEGQSFRSLGYTEQNGKFRVAVGCDSGTNCNEYPYRWGLGRSLGPGETVTVQGKIKLNSVRSITYKGGIVEENVKWHQRDINNTTINTTPAPTSCNDPFEPNETWWSSKRVSFGAVNQSYICSRNDVDWFFVTIDQPGRLVVDLRNIPSGKDYDIYLYHGENGFLTKSIRGSNADERIEWNINSSGYGYYDVKIYSYYGDSISQPYSISFNFTPGSTSLESEAALEDARTIALKKEPDARLAESQPDTQPVLTAGEKFVFGLAPLVGQASLDSGFYVQVDAYWDGVTQGNSGPSPEISCWLYWSSVPYLGAPWTSPQYTPMNFLRDHGDADLYDVQILPEPGLYEYSVFCNIDSETIWASGGPRPLTVYPAYSVLVSTRPEETGNVYPGSGYYEGQTAFTAVSNPGFEFERWYIYHNGLWRYNFENPLVIDAGQETYQVQAIFRPMVGQGIYGRVFYRGLGSGFVPLDLRFFDGSNVSTVQTTTTSVAGDYSFTNLPSLLPGQYYYVHYQNPGNPSFLYRWMTNPITEYNAGETRHAGDFEIQDVQLLGPNTMDDVQIPADFSWVPRSGYEERYQLQIYSDTPYISPAVTGDTYHLEELPYAVRSAQNLYWDVVIASAQGTGVAYASNIVRFQQGSGNLTGQITYEGRPEDGVHVGLMFNNGSSWAVLDWTATDADGFYHFSRLPALQNGQAYVPFYLNFDETAKPNRIWYGDCSSVTEYDANASNFACTIETRDIFLEAPFVDPMAFPINFHWTSRPSSILVESYQLNLYDYASGMLFSSDPITGSTNFVLNSLPQGFTGGDYYWEIQAFNGQSRMVSYALNHVNPPNKIFLPLTLRLGGSMTTLENPSTLPELPVPDRSLSMLTRSFQPLTREELLAKSPHQAVQTEAENEDPISLFSHLGQSLLLLDPIDKPNLHK